MKRTLIICISVLWILSLLTSCGSGQKSASENGMSFSKAMESADKADSQNAAPTSEKKIIKNATLGLEVESSQDAYAKLLEFTQTNGGYEFSKNTSREKQYTVVQANLRIPPERLDDLIEYAASCGQVINSTVNSEDITDQYTDTQIRLNTMKASLNRYYELLKSAANVDEVLKIQAQIDKVTADIESAEGRLNVWNKRLAESNVALTIRERGDPVKISKTVNWRAMSFSDMGLLIRNGTMGLYNTLALALQWLLILFIILLPVLLLVGLVIWIRFRQKRRK